jgi:hypothetical protein
MFRKKETCEHHPSKLDLFQTVGIALMALWKAISVYNQYKAKENHK